MHEGAWFKRFIIDKMTAIRQFFFRLVLKRGYACAMVVHTRADQLLPQLLMLHFDTLPSHYSYIAHLCEEVWL